MKDRIADQCTHHRLCIFDSAVEHRTYQLRHIDQIHVDKLIVVRIAPCEAETGSHIDVDQLIRKTRRGSDSGQVGHLLCGESGFLSELTVRAVQRILAGVQFARGDFHGYPSQSRPELADQADMPVIRQRDDGDGAGCLTTSRSPLDPFGSVTVSLSTLKSVPV